MVKLKTRLKLWGNSRAFLDDPEFYDPKCYMKFAQYLPPNTIIVEKPSERFAMGYALGLEGEVSEEEFLGILDEGWVKIDINKPEFADGSQYTACPKKGDIILIDYSSENFDIGRGILHSGICTCGNINSEIFMKSMWRDKAPVIEHEISILPLLHPIMNSREGVLFNFSYYREKGKLSLRQALEIQK